MAANDHTTTTIRVRITDELVAHLGRISWDAGENYYQSQGGDRPIAYEALSDKGRAAVNAGVRAMLEELQIGAAVIADQEKRCGES